MTRDYIRIVDSPSDSELQEAMAGVDCAVQLRYPDHGESSCVVNQLLALKKPVVCMRTGAFAELDGAIKLVAPDVSSVDLADVIEGSVLAGWPAAADGIVAARSPWAFEASIRRLVGV